MSDLLFAQASLSQSEFKPNGAPIVTIFTDFTSTTSNSKSNNAFDVTRAYLGYGYHFSKNFYGKIVLDVANTPGITPSSFTSLLKNAFLEYSNPVVSVDMGMICTSQFSLQEYIWGKRFLAKTLQDQYGFSSSADLGADVTVKVTPQVAFDFQVLNGEGYQKVQSDSTLKVAVGLTAKPIKNLVARLYVDYMKKNVAQKSFNAFLAYTGERFTLGAEYDLQDGNKMILNHNFSGISLYGTYNMDRFMAIFVRFDNLTSKKIGSSTTGWNSCDGQTYMTGLVFTPVKGVQISPNVRYWHPSSDLNHGSTSFVLNLGLNF